MAKLNLTDEQRQQRAENMRRVRREYYEKIDPAMRYAYSSIGGRSRRNPHKFNSETAKKASEARWNKLKEK